MESREAVEASARVLLVDDHAIVRRGLRSILELEHDVSVVAEAGGRSEALRALERTKPDVVLLDLKLSSDHDAEGLELCSEILERRPESNVVILSTFLNEEQYVVRCARRRRRRWASTPPSTRAFWSDQTRAPQPFIHGNKMSFMSTPNLEFGMGVSAIFGGPGLPFTG